MSVVDASVWVSALVAVDQFNADSVAWLVSQSRGRYPVVMPSLALAEIAGAVRRRTGSEVLARSGLARVTATPGLRIVNVTSQVATAAAFIAARFGLRGADAVYVAVARAGGLPLVTWDQEMITRCAGFIDVRTP